MASALIALGSNLGDRQRILDDAVAALAVQPNVVVLARSEWHSTGAIGGPADQPRFLNGAVLLGTSLSPQQLHAVLKQIELSAGRTREDRWGPRTLDIDLLLYDKLVIDTPELVIPHPRMSFRRFVLEPAAEIAGWMVHPSIGWTIKQLRDHLPDSKPRYLAAIAGPIAAGKTELVTSLARVLKSTSHRISPIRFPDGFSFEPSQTDAEIRTLPIRWIRGLRKGRMPSMSISDCWFGQSACAAEMALSPSQFASYMSRFHEMEQFIATPHLLVLLDVPAEISWQRIVEGGERDPPRIDWLARYRESLLRRIATPGLGPLLRLDGTKPDEARDELVAAIQAMM